MYRRARQRIGGRPWIQRSLLLGAALAVAWTLSDDYRRALGAGGLRWRVVQDVALFVVLPGALALAHRQHLGWRLDRDVLRNTALFALVVLPFYLVGSSLPTVRAYYPMWRTSTALSAFLPHAAAQFVLAAAAETYYRGLLCVGVRDLGRKSVLLSPVLYAFHHVHKPPIELALAAPTDVLFGVVDYETDSVLPSVVAHGAGLALLDWLVLHPPLFPPEQVLGWLSWLPVPL
ncbi:MAG: CPBP family intramembrane glutamic endopeptidase [Haloarculaceae archaeon]